ncbi:MAG: hypothetical protein ACRENQ_02775, partial [Gemmatimonadaceae bacterium]
MYSTRTRLTTAYAGLLFATMLAFGGALYFARRASALDELGSEARGEARMVLNTIIGAQANGRPLTFMSESPISGGIAQPTLAMSEALGRLPGYFLVLDPQDRLLYSSATMRLLVQADQDTVYSVARDSSVALGQT